MPRLAQSFRGESLRRVGTLSGCLLLPWGEKLWKRLEQGSLADPQGEEKDGEITVTGLLMHQPPQPVNLIFGLRSGHIMESRGVFMSLMLMSCAQMQCEDSNSQNKNAIYLLTIRELQN